jgi:hypothetical protein
MHVADQPTCGQGLAQNAAVPSGLAAVAGGLARNLEVHMNALDLDDPPAAEEHTVYERVAALLRRAEGDLTTAAAEMGRARDLPMGRHDMAAMTSPEVLDAFERHVGAERALHAVLGERRAATAQMLEGMRATIGERPG